MKKFNFKKNYFFSLFIFTFLILNIFFPINPKIIQANNLFLFNDFSFKFPPVNLGSVLQRKSGPLVVDGFRSTSYARFDSVLQIPQDAGEGKVLTSDDQGNATWQEPQVSGGEPVWGYITGNIGDQSCPLPCPSDLMNTLDLRAPLISPNFTNNARSTTPPVGDDDTSIATTEFVNSEINNFFADTGTWTDLGSVVRLSNLNHNISIGANNIIFKGGSATANRFIHTLGTNNLFMGLGTATGVSSFGSGNTGIGANSFTFLTFSGNNNTGLGRGVLNNNSSSNLAIGAGSRGGSGANSINTGVGVDSLANLSASNPGGNAAFGFWSLKSSTLGGENVSIGLSQGSTSGSFNTLIGSGGGGGSSFNNITTIGYGAGVNASNRMAFGITPSASNHTKAWGFGTNNFVSGNTNYAIRVGSQNGNNGNEAGLTTAGVWTNASDLNKKTNIQNLNYGLKEVLKLRPVSFNWKDSNTHDIGFIAQEVKEIIPELVYGKEGDLSLAYSQVPVVLVNAIAEQNQELILDQNNFTEFEKELNIIENKIKNAQ